jgi:hypothetical protein
MSSTHVCSPTSSSAGTGLEPATRREERLEGSGPLIDVHSIIRQRKIVELPRNTAHRGAIHPRRRAGSLELRFSRQEEACIVRRRSNETQRSQEE